MRKLFSLLPFLWILCALPTEAQKKKNLPLAAKVGVPNGVWIDTLGIFVDQTEIANIHWQQYCAWVKDHEPDNYLACLPDTTVWLQTDKAADTHVANYYSYVGFKFFPLVGITKAQAESFCAWRSKIVNEGYRKMPAKGIFKTHEVEITYRLPTEKEWNLIAQGNNQDVHGFAPLKNKYKRTYPTARANCKAPQATASAALATHYIFVNPPNEQGVYNMIGNVAEMVQEEGIAKGGSWTHTLEASAIAARQTYTNPTAWLGFRCVATIKLTPKQPLPK